MIRTRCLMYRREECVALARHLIENIVPPLRNAIKRDVLSFREGRNELICRVTCGIQVEQLRHVCHARRREHRHAYCQRAPLTLHVARCGSWSHDKMAKNTQHCKKQRSSSRDSQAVEKETVRGPTPRLRCMTIELLFCWRLGSQRQLLFSNVMSIRRWNPPISA